MGMKTPTWLMFLFLGIAALGPHVSPWPRGWIAYYGALLACWILMSVMDLRRAAREERQVERTLARLLPHLRAASETEMTEAREATEAEARAADAERRALVEERLIIVARDKVDLYDRLRRDQLGQGAVMVVADRRRADRRRKLELFIPERRLGERRLCDVSELLETQGWAELTLPKS